MGATQVKKRKKMVLIGAGSAMFTQGLVMDLINNPGHNSWRLALVDTDTDTLRAIERLVRKMIAAKNVDIEVEASTERRDVLPDADYVVCTIGVGGRRAWEQDVLIPRKYGVNQPVGDTAMPGGISRAMRMIPAMLALVQDVQTLCPQAYLFNYSNPMAMICRAVRKSTVFPMVGLCIGVPSTQWYIADFVGLEHEDVSSLSVGINHLTFIYDFRHKGKDAWPLVREKLAQEFKEDFDETVLDRFYAAKAEYFYLGEPFAWNFFKEYSAFPAPGDRHITEFFPERFPGGKYYGKTLGISAYSFEGVVTEGDTIHENAMRLATSEEPLPDDFFLHMHGEHEQLMEIINAIENDERKVFSVNVPNVGAVPNLPYEAVLEMPAIATAKGFRQIHIDDYPDVLAGFISRQLSIIELAVDAALKGDRKLFAEAILQGGYITDKKAVHAMVDELITAQKQYLPQF